MPKRGPGAAGSAAPSTSPDPPPLTPRAAYKVLRRPEPFCFPMWRKHRAPPHCVLACKHARMHMAL
eukprot:4846210-Karenia_brevis.AAC.1